MMALSLVLAKCESFGVKNVSNMYKKIYKDRDYIFSKLKNNIIVKFNLSRSSTISLDF